MFSLLILGSMTKDRGILLCYMFINMAQTNRIGEKQLICVVSWKEQLTDRAYQPKLAPHDQEQHIPVEKLRRISDKDRQSD